MQIKVHIKRQTARICVQVLPVVLCGVLIYGTKNKTAIQLFETEIK